MKKQHKENLTKLANYIINLDQEVFTTKCLKLGSNAFAPSIFRLALDWITEVKGLEPIDEDFDWVTMDYGFGLIFNRYCERVFGLDLPFKEWMWCFDCQWSDIDNTPTGASKRIMELVNEGLPDDWFEQMDGDEPYMFAEAKDEQV